MIFYGKLKKQAFFIFRKGRNVKNLLLILLLVNFYFKTMKKKIILASFAALSAVVALPLLSAFEAHIINVTARIENALAVNTIPIDFGTVFPQEQLDRRFDVRLSGSFMDEKRVDDVEYIIRQKPKCGWTDNNGEILVGGTKSGHVDDNGIMHCPIEEALPNPDLTGHPNAKYGQLPLLCRYLSKHKIRDNETTAENDQSLNAFHEIGSIVGGKWVWNDVHGRLAKSENDLFDIWNLDLKVPCFGGHCAQDWHDFVKDINPDADPNKFIENPELEHKVFGCDVWIEVTGVSEKPITGISSSPSIAGVATTPTIAGVSTSPTLA